MTADPASLSAAREAARQAFDSFRPSGMMAYGGFYQKVFAACEAYAAALSGASPANECKCGFIGEELVMPSVGCPIHSGASPDTARIQRDAITRWYKEYADPSRPDEEDQAAMLRLFGASPAPEPDAFTRHLEEAAKIVDGWPEWKKTVLGVRPISGEPAAPTPELERQASRLRDLRADWDSYGSLTIDERAIQAALSIARTVPQLVPCSDGGVQLEWNGLAEVELAPDGTQECDFPPAAPTAATPRPEDDFGIRDALSPLCNPDAEEADPVYAAISDWHRRILGGER